jgi:hypothetical protein
MKIKMNIHSCDKSKLRAVIEKINVLLDETPASNKNLLRYVFNNEKKSLWEGNYLYLLCDSGVIEIYSKEIDVDGENIFYLQLLDKGKLYKFKGELGSKNVDTFSYNKSDVKELIDACVLVGKEEKLVSYLGAKHKRVKADEVRLSLHIGALPRMVSTVNKKITRHGWKIESDGNPLTKYRYRLLKLKIE